MRNLYVCSLAAGALLLGGTGAFARIMPQATAHDLNSPPTAQEAAAIAHTKQVEASPFGLARSGPVTEPMTAQDAALGAHTQQVQAARFGALGARPVTEPMTAQDAALGAHAQQFAGAE
ncbi:MAG TPA: hypothetical protein VKV77_01590 [Methylovirgula sp.]|nr:hypothetical protein [Methylovirgula sp.]